MNKLFDIPLPKPLPDAWLHGLLFTTFALHLLFVLFTLGTAILAVYYFVDFQWGGRPKELELDRRILRTFLAHKSLAVVLGVAPLLLFQVAYTVPLLTAINFLAPYWLLIILFLIGAFLSFDILGHGIQVHRYVHLLVSIIALTFLLLVPGILVGVLTITENSGQWLSIVRNGYRLTGPIAGHWLFRYLHVLGAALVFGAAYHYFFTARHESGRNSLLNWLVAGVLLQFILGPVLLSSLLEKPDTITLVILFAGVGGAALLLGAVFFAIRRSELLNFKTVLPLLLIVLVAMLLTRQLIQNKKIIPLENRVTANALTYDQELQPYAQAALTRYQASLALSYDRAETLYLRSCAFCHGKNAAGNGIEAKNLEVPPENLAAMRTTLEYLYKIILGGVRGTGMGYFSIYDRYQLDNLITYLHEKYQVLGPPGELPAAIPPQALARSEDMYRQTCAVCHGLDGQGAALSQGFQPPPPNLALYSLTPARTFAVITQGYPGTMMPAFGDAPEEVRWGLVKIVTLKRMSKN